MLTGPRAWAAEFIGTFAFVMVGMGVAVRGGPDPIGVAAAHGIALAVMIAVFGKISGAHFNPGITLSVWLGRRMRAVDALAYVGAQVSGGVVAAAAVVVLLQRPDLESGYPRFGDVPGAQAFILEMLFTFFLAIVIWGVGVDDRGANYAPWAIGGTVFAAILVIGGSTGGSLNPARYLGPALVAGDLSQWWLYVPAPLVGATLAGLVYQNVFMGQSPARR